MLTVNVKTSLYPIKKWPHIWPTPSGWRHLIFNSKRNGLDEFGVIIRIGSKAKRKRILIDEAAFFRWLRRYGLAPEFFPQLAS